MSEEKKYRTWTSADIEEYHKGLLSSKEMNELERAALDDPFLADALEGYGNVKINLSEDISELEKKLAQRVSEGKVVRISGTFSFYNVLKIAAVIVLLAGGALLIYQLGFNNRNKPLAIEESKQAEQPESQRSLAPVMTDSIQKNGNVKIETPASGVMVNKLNEKVTLNSTVSGSGAVIRLDSVKSGEYYTLSSPQTDKAVDKAVAPASKDNKEFESISLSKQSKSERDKDQFGDMIIADSSRRLYKKEAAAVGVNSDALFLKAKAPAVSNNYFNGRIVDNNNNAVPFANVTNIKDNVGTYADANGFFTLISPDTSLNLRIKSVGFQSDTVKFIGSRLIGNGIIPNGSLVSQVTLKDDKITGVVLGGKRVGSNPKPEANIKIEEPEPADGWSNYGLYLVNNLKVPDQINRKEARGEVQISFEINKLGEPVNIKVEKSLCKECDEEAKRLIQQGPKWKPNKKKKRVTVNVPFQPNE